MVKALQRWLAMDELPVIVLGVAGALLTLAVLMLLGGYLMMTPT